MTPSPFETGEAKSKPVMDMVMTLVLWIFVGAGVSFLLIYAVAWGWMGVASFLVRSGYMGDSKVADAKNAESFVGYYVISPVPESLHQTQVIYIHAPKTLGDYGSCSVAYEMDPATFGLIHHGKGWSLPPSGTPFADYSFRKAWPDYHGVLEHYYFRVPRDNHRTWIVVSADHTKAIFEVTDPD